MTVERQILGPQPALAFDVDGMGGGDVEGGQGGSSFLFSY